MPQQVSLLDELLRRRILLVTGKGGVGRSTLAAALAIDGARTGRRTLLVELGDPDGGASPLAQLFGRERFGPELSELAVRLRACQLWAPTGHELFLRDVLPGGALLGPALRSRPLQAFLGAAPSFLEMGWLYHLLTLIRQQRAAAPPPSDPFGAFEHQRIVIDLPATGHTLALTSLPDILERLIRSGPVVEGLRQGQEHLRDPAVTGAVVVTLPETLPVSESLELIDGLRRTRIPIAGLILNRVPPDPFDAEERAAAARALAGADGVDVLGAVALGRIERAGEARRRLQEAALPTLEVLELERSGAALLAAVASELQVAGARG